MLSGGGRSRSNSVTSMKSDSVESDFSGSMLLTAPPSAVLAAGVSHTPRDSRIFISSGSSGVSSGDDDDREFGCADSCQSGSDGDYDDRMRMGSPLCEVFSPGDEDTIKSARAVVSLSSSHLGPQGKFAAPPPFSSSPPPSEHAVVIDDDAADITKSKLSSVFGKPLRELVAAKAALRLRGHQTRRIVPQAPAPRARSDVAGMWARPSVERCTNSLASTSASSR
jgi:hypothetical protein